MFQIVLRSSIKVLSTFTPIQDLSGYVVRAGRMRASDESVIHAAGRCQGEGAAVAIGIASHNGVLKGSETTKVATVKGEEV